jgi:hypothetical protein
LAAIRHRLAASRIPIECLREHDALVFRTPAALLAPALVIALGLCVAQPAAASDYCVLPQNPACSGSQAATLQAALTSAAGSPDADRIFLGAATYTAPTTGGYEYTNAAGPVELIGEGSGKTFVTGPASSSNVLKLSGGAGTTVRDLSVYLPQMLPNGVGLTTNGTAKGIVLGDAQAQSAGHYGVWLHDGGTLEDSSVTLALTENTTGVYFGAGGGTMRNSKLTAAEGVRSDYGGTIERSSVTGSTGGVIAGRGSTVIKRSVIRTTAPYVAITVFPLAAEHVSVDAEGVTLVPAFGSASHGVRAVAFDVPGESVTVNLRNSIIRGFYTPMQAETVGAGTATITASYSDYDTSMATTTGANATIAQSNISYVANPGFVDTAGGDYHLLPNSPLVDAGDPATGQGLDFDGNPLVTDGNLDGIARRDLGAFELPGPLPKEGDPPPPLPGTTDATPTGGGEQPAARTADTQPPVISRLTSSNTIFAIGRVRTAVSAVARGTTLGYVLSEPATVMIKIQRAGGGRTVGRLRRSAVKGVNVIRFSGRIGRRALAPGRYRAVVTATDATGNRSAPRRLSFRVVKG